MRNRVFGTARPGVLAAVLVAASLISACGVATSQPGATAVVAEPSKSSPPVPFPNDKDSLKFLVFGDFGTGEKVQYDLAGKMAELHKTFPFEIVMLVGDNIYGSERPQDFQTKFEIPYKPLLDAKVKFYASLGNHDSREQRMYKLFNMEEKYYYSVKAPKQSVRFYALESTYPVTEQLEWIEKELKDTTDDWKIPFMHHAMYSSARAHGSTGTLRKILEPLFIRYNVSVVFSGHDHVYERVKPQGGIVYFVVGSAGKLRPGDLDPRSPLTAAGYDRDLTFFAGEIKDDNLTFQVINRTGAVVDSGIIVRRKPPEKMAMAPPSFPAPASAWRFPSPPRTLQAPVGRPGNPWR